MQSAKTVMNLVVCAKFVQLRFYLSLSSKILREGATGQPDYTYVQRNLALELVRVTEAAALSAGRWLGKVRSQEAFKMLLNFLCASNTLQGL